MGAFSVLLCFSAFVKIPLPFTPVPVTLQNMIVFLAGAMLGSCLGMSAVLLYIIVGFLGAPLFANSGAGIFYLFGPTGGYLIGFILTAGLVGYLTATLKSKNIFLYFGIMLAGVLVIYGAGGLWLALGYHWPFKEIVFLGILPFVGPDILKALGAAVVAAKMR